MIETKRKVGRTEDKMNGSEWGKKNSLSLERQKPGVSGTNSQKNLPRDDTKDQKNIISLSFNKTNDP